MTDDTRKKELGEALIYGLYVLEHAEKKGFITRTGPLPDLTDDGRALAKRMFDENRKPKRDDLIAVLGIDMGTDWDSAP